MLEVSSLIGASLTILARASVRRVSVAGTLRETTSFFNVLTRT